MLQPYFFSFPAMKLQKKWKGLRDSYVREVKKMKTLKSGSGAAKRRKYIFFDALSFLKPLTEKQFTESITDDTVQEESTADEPTNATTQPSTSFSRRTKARNQVHENELMKKLSSHLTVSVMKVDSMLNKWIAISCFYYRCMIGTKVLTIIKKYLLK